MKFRSDRGPIAIVGCGFRMPGAAGDGFWDALIAGRSLVSTVPADRWAQEPYLHPRKTEPGTAYTFAAGTVGDVSGFDAAFFGISPREAAHMDPQQRVLLEMAWEAFENALIPPSSMRGSRCGVFVGLSSLDYAYRYADDLGSIDAATMTGNTGSIAANRISYMFDLRGPSLIVDTACSSSLVALHQACQSIRHGETDAAIAAGISLHLHPYPFIGFSKASMLSKNGRCAVFDEEADGYVRAEGGAVVLLKPLTQAVADGNRVLAVIAGTGVNSDGRKNGLTVPSHTAQAALLREVYERAGIPPAAIDYFEAHGTGTAVGDPIEALAIGEALGRERPRARPLAVGSVKGNVGHLEAAAGMAGLVKSLYVLRHRRVPANLHLRKPSSHIDFAGLNLAPVIEPLTLDAGRRIIVGVSAFGFGGTNAHAVLTSFEAPPAAARAAPARPPLLLSARSQAALRDSARSMSRFLRERADLPEYDIAYSALFGRDVHPHRLLVTGEDRGAVAAKLERYAESGAAAGLLTGRFRADASPPAFVYSGNGSQWVGMGVQLLDEDAVFREALEEVDSLLRAHTDRSVITELRAAPAESRLDRTEIAQPTLFAIQVGLTRMLERAGVRPAAVCGHSVGEVAAGWASGALSLDAAVRVIHERSAHQALTRGQGNMSAIELGEEEMAALLGVLGLASELTIAAVNGSSSVTVAGAPAALARLETTLTRRGVTFRRLALDYAFHSRAMDGIREGLLASLTGLASQEARIPLYSTVTGAPLQGTELGATYWWRNIREPVRFAPAIRALLDSGINTFLEIGPRPVLIGYLNEIGRAAERTMAALPSLTTTEAGAGRVRSLVDQLELSGALPSPTRLFPVPGRLVELPQYPWQRERYAPARSGESLGLLERRYAHPLLGYKLGDDPLQWENHLDTSRFPALADHKVGGACVFPAAGFVEMALAAGAARRPGAQQVIEDFELVSPLVLERDHSSTVRFRLDADGSFTITSRDRAQAETWRTHAVGRLVENCLLDGEAAAPSEPAGTPQVTAATHYALAGDIGLDYGATFRTVEAAWIEEGGLVGSLALAPGGPGGLEPSLLHPALLDGAFQLLIDLVRHELIARGEAAGADPPCFLPARIGRLELMRSGERAARVRVRLGDTRHRSRRALLADFELYREDGTPVALVRGVRFRVASVQRSARPATRCIATRAVPMPRRDNEPASPMLPTAELADLVARRLQTPKRSAARQRYSQEIEPLLDGLCAAFAERALRSLSGRGGTLDLDQWLASGSVSPEARALLDRLVRMLAEDGALEPAGEGWRWTSVDEPRFPEPADIWMSLIGDYPEYASITARVGSAGLNLATRLAAGVKNEPREQSLAESPLFWLDGATQEEGAAVYAAVADLVAALAASQRPEKRLRVLRIAGAAPREELARTLWPLPDHERCDLNLAAPTQALLDEVRTRLAPLTRFPCRVLDLDQPASVPLEESLGRFDVVILGEGFADAADPLLRLTNVRRLLLDGGLLIAVEQPPSRAADLVFGLNASWWRKTGGAAHSTSRWRKATGWSALIGRAGFGDLKTVSDAAQAHSGPYLLIARAENAAEQTVPHQTDARSRKTWLLVHDAGGDSAGLASALVAGLEPLNQRVVHVLAGSEYHAEATQVTLDPTSTEHWMRLLAELEGMGVKPDGWVHLAGLDLRSANATTAARAALQRSRGEILIAWLRSCARSAMRPACFVVGAHAGLSLLPSAVLATQAGTGAAPDRLRDAVLWGLTRVAMQEFAELKVRWVDLLAPLPLESSAAKLVAEILDPDAEDEILLTSEGRFVPRLDARTDYRLRPKATSAAAAPLFQLDFATPGPFRNLEWRRSEAPAAPLAAGEIEIEVHATGLNFRDVMYAMGLLPDEAVENGFCGPALGIELAGVVTATGPGVSEFAPGDEVMAIAPGAFATRVRTPAWAATPKPRGWSLTAAATVPTTFFTAYYALVELARLREGERVLIHGAAGGVGIAAVQIARHFGAEVFATAGSGMKRDFVTLLGADHVFDSRSLSFADEILAATGGEGVDVVLNSLAGEAMRRTVRLLKPFGRMLELGKRDFYENSRLGLRPLRNNISYFGIDAEQLLAERPELLGRCFGELRALFASGLLRPLPHQCFPAAEVEAAFRYMQASRHIGKIVMTYPEGFEPLGPEKEPLPPPALRADATYLVTGGLSGLGLRTAFWLAERGARHLALVSRRGAASPEAETALARFAAAGVTVRAISCDIADAAAVRSALAELDAAGMPPLRGVIHAAMVIEDALIRDMDGGQLERVLAPKVAGALALDEATRQSPLDFFVLYSSATTLFGNPGQGAYVAANVALEALAAQRQAQGLPATCIAFGPIADVGYLARNDKVREALVGRIGGRALTADSALEALGSLITAEAPTVGVLELDWSILGRVLPGARAPKFSELARGDERGPAAAEPAEDIRRWLEALPRAEVVPALTELVRTEVAQILRTPPDRIDPAVSLFEVGMDSLMAVELAASLEVRLGVQLSAMALSDGPTIERIAARMARLVRPGDESGEAAPTDATLAEQVRFVAAQHASEVSEGAAQAFSEELSGTEAAALSGTGRER